MTIARRKKIPTPAMTFAIGGINGLFVGLIGEAARVRYLNYEMSQAAREYARTAWAVDFTDGYWQPVLPLICVIVFAVAGYLVRRYFLSYPKRLLFIWLLLGGVAVGAGYLMSTAKPSVLSHFSILSFALVCYVVYRLWANRADSLPMIWQAVGITSVIAIALGVQLVGLFYYWPDLRRPQLWLLCLLGVIGTNVIYGSMLQFVFDRWFLRSSMQAPLQ
jgi:hypothetical protein